MDPVVRIVFDTNVLLASSRSRRGASFHPLQQLGSPPFQPLISPPLRLQHEDACRRSNRLLGYSPQDIDDFPAYLLSPCTGCRIHLLWRPSLPDPKDDLALGLALAGGATFIVTHNARDLRGAETFAIQAVSVSCTREHPHP